MKYISLILTTLSSFTAIGTRATSSNPYLLTDLMGGFDGTKDEDLFLEIFNAGLGHKLNITYLYHKTGKIYAEESYTLDDIQIIDGSYRYTTRTVTMPLKDRLTADGIEIKFQIFNGTTQTYTKTALIYAAIPTEINGRDYATKNYTISNRLFKLKESGSVSVTEYFKFNNIPTIVSNNRYNYIDLSKFSFTYGVTTIPLINPDTGKYLKIKDENHVFSHIPHDFLGYIRLPLVFTQTNTKVTMDLKGPFYINHFTMEMSLTKINGFAKTDKFYLPFYGDDELNETDCVLYFENFGRNYTTVTIPLIYEKRYKFFGSCDEATYCIGGGEKE